MPESDTPTAESRLRSLASLTDPSDRAEAFRAPGNVRIPLKSIGFWPNNRGGAGISLHHVHEVAHDFLANRTTLTRYHEVKVVELSAEAFSHVRKVNGDRAKADSLLPKCYPDDIKYVCLTKTHFVHAQKLAADGGRTLYNEGNVPITWQDGDTEGKQLDPRRLCRGNTVGLQLRFLRLVQQLLATDKQERPDADEIGHPRIAWTDAVVDSYIEPEWARQDLDGATRKTIARVNKDIRKIKPR